MNDESTVEEMKKQIAALEEQLRQSQKMAAIGSLAGGIAHDFNNILSAILGFAELARLQIDPGLKKAEHSIGNIIKAGQRAQKLVGQILSITRSTRYELRPVRVGPIISEALNLLKATFPSTIGIRCDINAAHDAIMSDPTQIHQIFMNLCTNSLHAMNKHGGTLRVNLDNAVFESSIMTPWSVLKPGSYVRLSVTDTGQGILPETMPRIFEPYFTTKKEGVGTGLGLSIIYGIIKTHQGGIDVRSQPGQGSEFMVFFPVIDQGAVNEELSLQPVSKGRERILFVDDEAFLVELANDILRYLGYEVHAEQNVITALEIFKTRPDQFDLVITDLTMPQMTGDELAREIKKIRPDIPVILCTGHSSMICEEQINGMRIDALIYKPLEMQKTAKVIRDILEKGNSH